MVIIRVVQFLLETLVIVSHCQCDACAAGTCPDEGHGGAAAGCGLHV
jgi:hypothetical protein